MRIYVGIDLLLNTHINLRKCEYLDSDEKRIGFEDQTNRHDKDLMTGLKQWRNDLYCNAEIVEPR